MAEDWKLRLDPETRARWDAAAAEAGEKLAVYVREAVEGRIEGRLRPRAPARVEVVGKPFRGPDPKVKERPSTSTGKKR